LPVTPLLQAPGGPLSTAALSAGVRHSRSRDALLFPDFLNSYTKFEPGWSGAFFECGDCGFMFEDVAEFVEVLQDAGFRERIDGECYRWAALNRERLSSEVDGHQGSRFQQRVRFRIDDDREKAVLESVLAKDVGEARRDDSLEAKVCQRPDGVLA